MYPESAITRIRRRRPWLTPPWNPDDVPADEELFPDINRPPPSSPVALSGRVPEQVRPPAPIMDRTDLGAITADEINPRELVRLRSNAPINYGSDTPEGFRGRPNTGFKGRLLSGLKLLGQIAPQAMGGSLPSALGAALASFGTGVAAPGLPYQIDRQRRTANEQQQLSDDQSYRLNEARIGDIESQAEARLRPDVPTTKYDWFPVDLNDDGIPDTEEYRPVQGGVRRNMFPKPQIERQPPRERVQNPDGTIDIKEQQPDGSWKLIPDLTSRPQPKSLPEDTSNFTNAQLTQNIQEAETERNGIAAALKNIPAQVDVVREDGKTYEGDRKPNPIYQDYMTRYRQLDDQIRRWRADMKPSRTRTNPTAPRGRPWSKSAWQRANPRGDLNKAIQAAERAGATIVP